MDKIRYCLGPSCTHIVISPRRYCIDCEEEMAFEALLRAEWERQRKLLRESARATEV